jgi:PAS domain S-box-containing protein
MGAEEIVKLVRGTADPAFAIDSFGLITAWNTASEELFGLTSKEAIGQPCHEIVQGTDEAVVICSDHCGIQQALQTNRPVANFDLQIQTKLGRQWCNISVLFVTEPGSRLHHAVHIVHPREMRKRLEQLVRDFLVSHTELTTDNAVRLLSSARISTSNLTLTVREREILRLLAKGISSKAKSLPENS